MAYSKYKKIDPSRIEACLFYVTENKIIEPRVQSEAEVVELWSRVLAKVKGA
jgi:hypothetical protein